MSDLSKNDIRDKELDMSGRRLGKSAKFFEYHEYTLLYSFLAREDSASNTFYFPKVVILNVFVKKITCQS